MTATKTAAAATAATAAAEKPINDMTVAELQKLATHRGLSTTTKLRRKADLIAAIEKMAAPVSPAPVSAPPATNRCTVCSVRPIGSGKGDEDKATLRSLKMCNPCATEGGHENAHSDRGHETIAEKVANKKRLSAAQQAELPSMESCWICHPELNAARAEYVTREGTSREGMVVHARGGIAGKIDVVKTAGETAGGTVEITERTTGKGKDRTVISTTLVWRSKIGAQLTVVWDDRGRFQYGPSVAVGRISADTPAKETPRKIRNVAEALRFISAPV